MRGARSCGILCGANGVAPSKLAMGGALGVLVHKDTGEYMEDMRGGARTCSRYQVVDEDQHLELGQLVPRAGVHAAPKWQEGVRPRRHLQVTNNQRREGLVSSANCTTISRCFLASTPTVYSS